MSPFIGRHAEKESGRFKKADKALADSNFGTVIAPGPALWALRALAGILDNPAAATSLAACLARTDLPPLLANEQLWESVFWRERALMRLLGTDSTAESAAIHAGRDRALEALLVRWPDLPAWVLCTNQQNENAKFQDRSFLERHLCGNKQKDPGPPLRPQAVARLLVGNPLRGLTLEQRLERFSNLIGMSTDLDAHLLAGLDATTPIPMVSNTRHWAGPKVIPLVHAMTARGQWRGLESLAKVTDLDLTVKDSMGQTLFHVLVGGFSVLKRNGDDWVRRDKEEIIAKINALVYGWTWLVEHGVDPHTRSDGGGKTLRMSARTGKPVRTENWPPKAALPQEDPMDQLARFVKNGALAESDMSLLRANLLALRKPPSPSIAIPSKTRLRG